MTIIFAHGDESYLFLLARAGVNYCLQRYINVVSYKLDVEREKVRTKHVVGNIPRVVCFSHRSVPTSGSISSQIDALSAVQSM